MARYAMINSNGLVVNVIEVDPENPPKFEGYTLRASDAANIGDTYEGEKLVPQPMKPPPYFRPR